MDRFENDVRLVVYRLFVDRGRAPVAADVAEVLGAPAIDVERALRSLHDQHVLVLAPGTPYIWMANPLSALPTPYSVTVEDKQLWGNCIWDALGIVAMLRSDGEVRAPCPDCGDDLVVRVQKDEVLTTDYVVHYAVPAARWWDDIGFN